MKLSTPTDVAEFEPEQQDALLAEMQKAALADFEAAATLTERASAVRAFADAAQARNNLADAVTLARIVSESRARFRAS